MTTAKTKFMNTPATTMTARCQIGLEKNARSWSLVSCLGLLVFLLFFGSCKLPPPASSSPYNLTKPPIGKRLIEYSVSPNFLPQTFGGNPNPNSSTFTPNFLATKKWPNSCTNTRIDNIRRNTSAVVIMNISREYNNTEVPCELQPLTSIKGVVFCI